MDEMIAVMERQMRELSHVLEEAEQYNIKPRDIVMTLEEAQRHYISRRPYNEAVLSEAMDYSLSRARDHIYFKD